MNDINKDIEILESECYYLEELGYLRENNHFIRFNQALENLIKEYRKLEEELERQRDINTIINKQNLDDNYERALEKTMTKFLNENIENDYIPKLKVKEKIEELETKLKVFEKDIRYCKDRVQARLMNDEIYVLRRCMDLLKELMEDK